MTDVTDKPHVVYSKDDIHLMDLRTRKQVQRGWEIQLEIEKLQDEQKKIKEQLQTDYCTGVVLVIPKICRVPISETVTITIADEESLEELTGDHFSAYATRQTSVKPTKLYKEIILDEDHETHELINETAAIKSSVSCKFLPSK